MPTLFPRRFANPETLRSVSNFNLFAFLSRSPTREYLTGRGLVFPTGPEGEFDYDVLARILVDPEDGMPIELVDDLYLIHEMATEPIMLELLDAAPPELLGPSWLEPTPADVALQLLMADRKFLERRRDEHFLHRSRSFRICQGRGGKKCFPECTEPQKALILAALEAWFEQHRRGRKPQIEVYPQPEEGQLWIVVKRGSATRIQGTFNDGESSSVTFRPEAFDFVVYYLEQDILVVHTDTNTKGELELYRTNIGRHLFDDADYFASEGNLTLAPLMECGRAALNCDGIDGIESVSVTEWEVFTGKGRGMFVRVKADNVFDGMDDAGMTLPRGFGNKAVFRVRFTDSKKPRSVTLYPPSRDRYQRDDDRALMEQLFARNGFILGTKKLIDETACVTVDVT